MREPDRDVTVPSFMKKRVMRQFSISSTSIFPVESFVIWERMAERAQGVREAFPRMDDVCVNLEHDLLGQSMPPESKAGIPAYAEIPAVC